jgi:metal-responsive CopG/Arc/MetJ family transcriptional regulator
MENMSKRFTVTLPDSIYKELDTIAGKEGRSTANLAAFLIEQGVRDIKKSENKKTSKED